MREVELTDKRLLWDVPLGLSARPRGFAPARFPADIFDEMRAVRPGAITRMECPTGCSLHLHTDARRVQFEIDVLDTPRDWGEFAAVCEGIIIASWSRTAVTPGEYQAYLELPDARPNRPVEIVFPHLLDIVIRRMEIDGRLENAAPPPDPVWLAIGDSITQGMNAASPLSTYVRVVRDRLGIGAWNLGIGGQTMEPSPFEWSFARRPWCAVTIALGSNDWFSGVPIEDFTANASAMLEAAARGAPGAALFLITPPPAGREPLEPVAPLSAYREALARAAAAFPGECTIIDGPTLVSLEKDHFTPDLVHLSREGFAAYAEGLISVDRFREALKV